MPNSLSVVCWLRDRRFGRVSRGAIVGIVALAALPAAAWAAGATDPAALHAAARSVRWGFVIGLGAEAAVIVALALVGVPVLSFVIGHDKRVSTSKTIAVAWTLVVAAALIAIVYASLRNHPEALNATDAAGVMGQYALLFGGPLGAAILAKGIVANQVNKDPGAKPPAESTGPTDLVLNDAGEADIGDFQYVLFNAVALLFVVGMLLHEPLKGLPHIPDVLLGLTSVSAVGYVGKKALPASGAVTAKLEQAQGPARTPVTITVKGLVPPVQASTWMWVRFGADDPGQIASAPVADGSATLSATPPDLQPPPPQPVDVSVITPAGTVLAAGKFTYG
jgi:hypothetical protein